MSKRIAAGTILLCIAAVLLLAYSYFIEPTELVVRPFEIAIRGLDPALDGLKIVVISDLHGGSNDVTFEKLKEVTARANEQDADLVVLLGDFVSGQHRSGRPAIEANLKMPMSAVADGIAGLRARFGVFAVLGNHDGWYGDEIVAADLTRVGIKVLQSEIAVVQVNGRPLRILGFKDHLKLARRWEHIPEDFRELLRSAGEGDIIALEHSPDIMPEITGENLISPALKLVLAGHTHGGQVRLPILGPLIVPSSYGQKYAYGHSLENGVDLFVTSGIGTSILPIRFLVPPEIDVLTLRSS
jgi:predicted MPP superfamily phosphohydrolase